jgi:hypothetical protein
MGLFGRNVVVEVSGHEIFVTMPGTNYIVRYQTSKDAPGLVATSFGGRKDVGAKVTLPAFLAAAWHAANESLAGSREAWLRPAPLVHPVLTGGA